MLQQYPQHSQDASVTLSSYWYESLYQIQGIVGFSLLSMGTGWGTPKQHHDVASCPYPQYKM